MTELTDAQLDRLDYVHNTIYDCICDLTPALDDEVPWDMEVIGEISDIIEIYVCDKLHLMLADEFAPYIEV